MTRLLKTALSSANLELLDQQLKAALANKCYGLTADNTGLYVVLDDAASGADEATALSVCTAHNPNVDTAAQAAAKVGKTDIANLLTAADTALTQLAAKRATFQSASTLQNAAPLLLEIAQDLEGVIKALKFALTRIP